MKNKFEYNLTIINNLLKENEILRDDINKANKFRLIGRKFIANQDFYVLYEWTSEKPESLETKIEKLKEHGHVIVKGELFTYDPSEDCFVGNKNFFVISLDDIEKYCSELKCTRLEGEHYHLEMY